MFECGCGTGVFAERLLSRHLPPQARYLAVDSSATMVALARTRLARFGERFVSNYVLDLLSLPDMAHLLAEAHRLLVADGRLWQVESHSWFDPACAGGDLDLDAHPCAQAPSRGWVSACGTARLLATQAFTLTTRGSLPALAFPPRSSSPQNNRARTRAPEGREKEHERCRLCTRKNAQHLLFT
jgi:SAM-dependent methyltransferase